MPKNKHKKISVSIVFLFAAITLGFQAYFTWASTLSVTTVEVLPPLITATISGLPTNNIDAGTPLNVTIGGNNVTVYKYQFDNGPYSTEIPVSTKITNALTASGTHILYVVGGTGPPDNNWQTELSATTGSFQIGGGGGISYIPACGNGTLDPQIGETCDDGNITDGDGCSAGCQMEPVLADPSNCSATVTANSVTWQWDMTEGSEQEGFRLMDGSTLLKETLTPLVYEITEESLNGNTTYTNRSVINFSGSYESGALNCPNATTLMPEPTETLHFTANATRIDVSLPISLSGINLTERNSGVRFEIQENINGVMTSINNSGWIQNASFSFSQLSPNTTYTLVYKLRNADSMETVVSPSVEATTTDIAGSLNISKSVITKYPGQAEVNEMITYRISYNNTTGETLENIVFTDALSNAVAYVVGSVQSTNGFAETYTAVSHTLKITAPSLLPGTSGFVEYQVQVINPVTSPDIDSQTTASYEVGGKQYNETSNLLSLTGISSFIGIDLFNDFNGNGLLDASETNDGVGNPTVTLYRDTDNSGDVTLGIDQLLISQTANNGALQISNLESDNYVIEVTDLPLGYILAESNDYVIPLSPNASSTVNIALLSTKSTLQVNLFNDLNGNGLKDVNEDTQGIGNPTVTLYRDTDRNSLLNPVIDEVIVSQTATVGSALFIDIFADSYLIEVTGLPTDFFMASTNNSGALSYSQR